jgi:DME family drug/metabolite transporter
MGVALTGAGVLLAPALLVVDLDWLASGRGAGAVLHLGLAATALAYFLYGRGLARVPVAETTTLSLVEPVVAATLGLAVVGEAFTGSMAVGAALVAGALLVVGSSDRATER